MRKRNPVTELRDVKRALKAAQDAYLKATTEANSYRARATRAEQESAEWKRRFDALLLRVPEVER